LFSSYGFFTGELEGFDEVFVGGLGEAFTFFRVKVDVVYKERAVVELEAEGRG
jgi:hypothetical protein